MMKNKLIILSFLFIVLFLVLPQIADAQCPMCRIAAESNMKHGGGTEGKGLNNGILYLFAMPYLIIGTLAFLWWRNRKNVEEDQLLSEQQD